MKSCSYCHSAKPLNEFYRDKRGVYSARCKPCHGLAERRCRICKGSYVAKPGVKVCSPACAKRLRPQTFANCEQCGERFGPLGYLSARFCGVACKAASQLGKEPWNKGRAVPQLYRAETRSCIVCSTPYRATFDYKHKRQIYCSHRCYLKNRRMSAPERLAGDWLEANGLPLQPQHKVGRWVVDFYVEPLRLVVEVDGAFWHSSEIAKERDRRKDAEFARQGIDVVRLDADAVSRNVAGTCAAIVTRWERFTGQAATLEGDGRTFAEVLAERASPGAVKAQVAPTKPKKRAAA